MLSNNIRKKSFVVLFLMLFMCIFSYKTVYAQSITKDLGVKTNVDVDHSWDVRFNRNVDESKVNKENIKVTDSLGKEVEVKLATQGKIVKITPVNHYKYGETYNINVQNVKSTDKEELSQSVHMKFTVKEDTSKDIKTINDINKTVYKDDKYTLPKTVQVVLNDGSKKSVQVTWNSKSVDTSTVRTHVYSGTVSGYNGKVKLILSVKARSKKAVTICIDPGHGGRDSGAIGYSGTKEKDINLAVAKKLGNTLEERGINVVYTRKSDIDLIPEITPYDDAPDLRKRCDISNECKAKYTISIHCNSYGDHDVNGTETFYFPGSVEGQKLRRAVQKHIVEDLGNVYRVKYDGSHLYIIKHTKYPTILTELGFLSNPEEEKKLNTHSYQTKYANAIAKGVFDVLNMSY
ncbi:N-acetylmuramoyl-L-alanine amidase [Clostridium oceanicum]|uniref:MurNAc-LAA domain-containing protein n=1 Tax=Clostridium oceanicum TaxID=1543 RepID=A0ABN1JRQ2_9CLOT